MDGLSNAREEVEKPGPLETSSRITRVRADRLFEPLTHTVRLQLIGRTHFTQRVSQVGRKWSGDLPTDSQRGPAAVEPVEELLLSVLELCTTRGVQHVPPHVGQVQRQKIGKVE